MKTFKTSSDIGAVLIGNEGFSFAAPNRGGDGTTTVEIFDSEKEFSAQHGDYQKAGIDFVSSAQGTFGIFNYDCAYHELHSGKIGMEDAVCVLKGRYGVYSGEFSVIFVKWDD